MLCDDLERWDGTGVGGRLRRRGPCVVVKNLPANAGDVKDVGSIPGLGRSPEEGKGYPLQYSGSPGRSLCLTKSSACNAGDIRERGSIPGLGRSSGGGHGASNVLGWQSGQGATGS